MWKNYMKNVRNIIGFTILILMMFAFSFVTTSTGAEKPIVLILASSQAHGGIWEKEFFTPWFAELEKRTGGRVKIEAHHAEELVKLPDAFDATIKGIVDIAQCMPAMNPGRFPMDDIVQLPPYDSNCKRSSRVYWELFQEFPEMQKPYSEVKVLGLATTHMTVIGTKKVPIKKLEDNKGLKMIVPGKWAAVRGETLGWTPLGILPQDAYMALERGVADGGGMVALFLLKDLKWGDQIKHITLLPFNKTGFSFVMNKKKWDSLPQDIQSIMDGMSNYIVDLFDKVQVKAHYDRMEAAKTDFGCTFYTLTPEEIARWKALDKPVMAKFVAELESKGLPGKKLVDEYYRLFAKYSVN